MNRREARAMRLQRYAQAQWYAIDHERRHAMHNVRALWAGIMNGVRNPLRANYVN